MSKRMRLAGVFSVALVMGCSAGAEPAAPGGDAGADARGPVDARPAELDAGVVPVDARAEWRDSGYALPAQLGDPCPVVAEVDLCWGITARCWPLPEPAGLAGHCTFTCVDVEGTPAGSEVARCERAGGKCTPFGDAGASVCAPR